eukprot:gene33758-41647_t
MGMGSHLVDFGVLMSALEERGSLTDISYSRSLFSTLLDQSNAATQTVRAALDDKWSRLKFVIFATWGARSLENS